MPLFLAGCNVNSNSYQDLHDSSFEFKGTAFHADHAAIRVTRLGSEPPGWDQLTLRNRDNDPVRVRLNLFPTATAGHTLYPEMEFSLEPFGEVHARKDDTIWFCASSEERADAEMEFIIHEMVGSMRHGTHHYFHLRLDKCS